jgi:hypothetical protein
VRGCGNQADKPGCRKQAYNLRLAPVSKVHLIE